MQLALRPYATAGVALVGASVIAVSPVTVTPTAVQEVRDEAVHLSALVNPIDVFRPIIETALENAQTVGGQIADNPAPILMQVIANQLASIGNIGDGLAAQIGVIPELPALLGDTLASQLGTVGNLALLGQTFIENAVAVLTGSGPGSLQEQIQGAIDLINQGEFGQAFGNLAVLPLLPLLGNGLENIFLLPQLIQALQQPFADAAELFPIAAGPLGNVQNAIGVFGDINAVLPLGLGALLAVNGAAVGAGDTLGGLINAVQNGDPEAAFNAIVNGAAATTTALLTGALDPQFGLVAGLQGIREAIAEAITPPAVEFVASVAKAPSSAAQTFTLTAPLAKAPAPKAGAISGEDAAGAVATANAGTETTSPPGQVTPAGPIDATEGGNLVTPGTTATKGGRHRADTGSFAQGLRDAAEKTISGLTGLGRDQKSETSSANSKSGESASSSSGSGSANPGGGS